MQTIDQLSSGELSGATHIKLSSALTAIPVEIFDLADTLEILDLSGNNLSTLPDEFVKLKKLKILFLSDNEFTEFPKVLGQCFNLDIVGFKANRINFIAEDALPTSIRWLILTNNKIEQLPKSIGRCAYLQKLMLAGNQLSELPMELAGCKNLELLRISANRFKKFPSWLFSFPKLSWLALAGNAMNEEDAVQYDLQNIAWTELIVGQLLGEGASGMISKAQWQAQDEGKEVAIKVFKGQVTSDGFPADEMNACIAAGLHENLLNTLGKISNHPHGKQALVFDLIDSSYRNLGYPPNFKTCTRDTFENGVVFSLEHLLNIALGIASVMTHLHARGIMHGDLYAHNILIDKEANPLLSDFGAAFIYDKKIDYALAIERIEVRAFGCLLDDLIERISEDHALSLRKETLIELRNDCMNEDVNIRPAFSTIYEKLKSIRKSI